MDVHRIHRFLSEESYWAKGISYALIEEALKHSFCVGAFIEGEQVGFGRVITDYTTFGWFADFFVVAEHRGKGVAKALLTHLLGEPWSKRLRRKMLNTEDAHTLYHQFQFTGLTNPVNILEIYLPDIHLQDL